MAATLIVIRHAKSDWSEPVADGHRPLAKRGRKQAPAIGRWLTEHDLVPHAALVSSAERARATWELVVGELAGGCPAEVSEAAYVFDGDALLRAIDAFAPLPDRLAVVGHNPACEELVQLLTGSTPTLKTASIAVVEFPDWGSLRLLGGRLVHAGRPADGTI